METNAMTLKLKRIILAVTPALAVAVAAPALAADSTTPGTATHTQSQNKMMSDRRASDIIGADVHNQRGEALGEINDLIVDVNNGRVYYAVLSFGGIAGMGDKLFAYPLRAFKPASDRDELVLNVDQSKLQAAPGFRGDRWPDWNDNGYRRDVDRYYGDTVGVKPLPNQRLVRATELLDADVVQPDGNDIGEMQDLVVRLSDGKVRYAVLSLDDSWGLDDKLVVMPMKALRVGSDVEQVTLTPDRQMIHSAPAFSENHWPDLNDRAYRDRVDAYVAALPASTEASTGSAR
jgi:sporulation protein YlmC with PRC-barrel domain